MQMRLRRPRLWLVMGFLTIFIAGFWYFQATGPYAEPGEIFNQRFSRGNDYSLNELRKQHSRRPNDWTTRYWLASLLIESAKDENALTESLTLLRGGEKAIEPAWIPIWTEARRLNAHTRGLEILTAESSRLNSEAIQSGGDAQLKDFVVNLLTTAENQLKRLREAAHSSHPQNKNSLTGDEVREDLLTLKNLLSNRWAYIEEKEKQTGTSLEDLLAAGLARVKPQMSLDDATTVLQHFVAALEDGHTNLGYSAPQYALPFRLIESTEGMIVVETLNSSLGIEVGDRLVSVDEEPVEVAIDACQLRAISSTSAGRRAAATRSLLGHWNANRPYRVTIERAGEMKTIEMKTGMANEQPWSGAKQTKAAAWITSRLLQPEIGYMRITTWWPTAISGPMSETLLTQYKSEIDAALAEVKAATDLIVDVRNNGGGSDALCTYLASYFVPDPMKIYVLRYRITPGAQLPQGSDGFWNSERTAANYPRQLGPVLKPRLWVLMNAGSFSATDTFLNVLTRNIPDRVTTIGQPNGAGIGGPTLVGQLRNSGLQLTCSTCKVYSIDGELLEGNPVKLDYPLLPTRAHIVAGTDSELEMALKLIAESKTHSTRAN